MAEYEKGIKAGLIAGLIQGIVVGTLNFFLLSSLFAMIVPRILEAPPGFIEDIMEIAGRKIGRGLGVISLIIAPIGGAIGGLIAGLVFAILFDKIPGDSAIKKGLVFSLGVWFILGLLPNLIFPSKIIVVGLVTASISLIGWIIYGVLLGKFWKIFATKSIS